MNPVGPLVRAARDARGLRQEDLAIAIGIDAKKPQPVISGIENDRDAEKFYERLRRLAAIEAELGLPRGTFLMRAGWVDPPTSTKAVIDADHALTDERRPYVREYYDHQVALSRDQRAQEDDGERRSGSTAESTSPAEATRRRKSANS